MPIHALKKVTNLLLHNIYSSASLHPPTDPLGSGRDQKGTEQEETKDEKKQKLYIGRCSMERCVLSSLIK